MEKLPLLLLFLALNLTLTQSLPQDNIVIGVYTQGYRGSDLKTDDGSILTFVTPPNVNIASMTGAKVIPIFGYSHKDDVLAQLAKVNGVIFPGGMEYIYINRTWTANALTVLQYAIKENDAGRTFPILGLCQGLQMMLYLTSDKRIDFFDRIYNQIDVWNTVQFTGKDYYLIKSISDKTLQALKDRTKTPEGGIAYFEHQNGTLLSTFNNDKDINSFWNLIGTTTKGNQTFLSYLQAKKYPFYIFQFHPERLVYNNSMSEQQFRFRGELITHIALNFAMKCKQSPHRYAQSELLNDIIDNTPQTVSQNFNNYNLYLFHEWGPDNEKKQEDDGFPYGVVILWSCVGLAVLLAVGLVYFFVIRKRLGGKGGKSEKLLDQNDTDDKVSGEDQNGSNQKVGVKVDHDN